MFRLVFTLVIIFIGIVGFSQSKNDSTDISKYLYNQLDYHQTRLSCYALDSISSIEFYSTKMNFPTGDGGYIPTEYFLCKTGDSFKKVISSPELLCANEFIQSIKSNIIIKGINDALKFQEILDAVDIRNNFNGDKEIFKIDDAWYFIRDKFFEDYEMFVVHVSTKGKIEAIEYKKEKDVIVPDSAVKSSSHKADWGYKIPSVSIKDSIYLHRFINENSHFHFEFTALQSRLIEKITSAKFYKAKIVFTDRGFSNATVFKLMKYNDGIIHANSGKGLLKNILFLTSLQNVFMFNSEDDALTFEEALDVIDPISTFDVEHKAHLFKDGKWCFIRGESFGEKSGYVIETDTNGKIVSLTYDNKLIKQN